MKRLLLAAAGVGLLAVAGSLWLRYDSSNPAHTLSAVRTWDYQLQKLDLATLAASDADLLVIDYSRTGRADAALAAHDVQRLKWRTDGSRRLVIAYLSVGEAEEYRFYWRPEWKQSPPAWLFSENCRWPGNHLVRFWKDDWKEILFKRVDSYLAKILAAGFDGVYLDRIDAYWDLRNHFPQGEAEMKRLVAELADHARSAQPGFLIIAQNAEALLTDAAYRATIDGIAKEDLLHGVNGTGLRNDPKLIDWSSAQLRKLSAEDKAVLVVEYLTSPSAVSSAAGELATLGFVPTFPTRALDGRDPLEPVVTRDTPTGPATGTPEYQTKHCDLKEAQKS